MNQIEESENYPNIQLEDNDEIIFHDAQTREAREEDREEDSLLDFSSSDIVVDEPKTDAGEESRERRKSLTKVELVPLSMMNEKRKSASQTPSEFHVSDFHTNSEDEES